MGVELNAWRARIGCYVHRQGFRQIENILPYNGECKWSPAVDLTYRLLTLTMVCLVLYGGISLVTVLRDVSPNFGKMCLHFLSGNPTTSDDYLFMYTSTHSQHGTVTRTQYAGQAHPHSHPYVGHLLIIGGIELNPGPINDSMLDTLKRDLVAEIRQVRSDVNKDVRDLKQEIRGIRGQCAQVETACREMKEECAALSRQIKTVENELGELNEKDHAQDLDIDDLNTRLQDLEFKFENLDSGASDEKYRRLEEEIDRLEDQSRRDNLLFYNIAESAEETYDSLRTDILKMLTDKIDVREWTDRDIVRAHRVGRRQGDRPRPVIVRFLHWRDKKVILHNKQSLESVRVSCDLTWRQRKTLRELADEGKAGHFRGGRLIVYDRPRDDSRPRGGGQGARGTGRPHGGLSNHSTNRVLRSQSTANGSEEAS